MRTQTQKAETETRSTRNACERQDEMEKKKGSADLSRQQ